MRSYSNVINICGAGRNVGKTFLGESIISYFSNFNYIIAIKISKFKHDHKDKVGLDKVCEKEFYTIWEEKNYTNKDSGRYLNAGAKRSFYIECDDAHLLNAFLQIYNNYGKSCLVVCESASITKYINPAISIFVESLSYATTPNKINCLNRSTLVLKEKSIEISLPQLFLEVKDYEWISKYSENLIYHA